MFSSAWLKRELNRHGGSHRRRQRHGAILRILVDSGIMVFLMGAVVTCQLERKHGDSFAR
jgi:hypothetical protein